MRRAPGRRVSRGVGARRPDPLRVGGGRSDLPRVDRGRGAGGGGQGGPVAGRRPDQLAHVPPRRAAVPLSRAASRRRRPAHAGAGRAATPRRHAGHLERAVRRSRLPRLRPGGHPARPATRPRERPRGRRAVLDRGAGAVFPLFGVGGVHGFAERCPRLRVERRSVASRVDRQVRPGARERRCRRRQQPGADLARRAEGPVRPGAARSRLGRPVDGRARPRDRGAADHRSASRRCGRVGSRRKRRGVLRGPRRPAAPLPQGPRHGCRRGAARRPARSSSSRTCHPMGRPWSSSSEPSAATSTSSPCR